MTSVLEGEMPKVWIVNSAIPFCESTNIKAKDYMSGT
jgi:hypothetical protein